MLDLTISVACLGAGVRGWLRCASELFCERGARRRLGNAKNGKLYYSIGVSKFSIVRLEVSVAPFTAGPVERHVLPTDRRFPTKDKQSDTRIIFKSSKNLLSTQKFKLKTRKRKREVLNESKSFNNFRSYDGKYLTNEDSVPYDVDVQSTTNSYPINSSFQNRISIRNLKTGQSTRYLTQSGNRVTSENDSDNSAWNISGNSSVSGTLKIIHRQNDRNSELLTEQTERPIGRIGIERPMPPVLDHNSKSFITLTTFCCWSLTAINFLSPFKSVLALAYLELLYVEVLKGNGWTK
ncbi:hypothetical protein FQA39_LY03976 [Lamprigera yunnana]|nr:hypothetical protein FQA39_LY03976 [Lamprigera yunnana]